MGFETSASLTTDQREINTSSTWSSNSDWTGAQTTTNVVVDNGYVRASSTELQSVYEFEENGDTTRALDTRRVNNASINGPVYTTDSQYGSYSLDFDGVDDLCESQNADIIDNELSVSLWVQDRSGSNRHHFIGSSSNTSSYAWWLSSDDNGDIYYRDSDVGGDILNDTTSTVRDGTWHHVGVVVDPTNDEVRLFFDGSLDYTWSGTLGSYSLSDVNLQIGNNGNTNTGRYHDGLLDDIRIFKRTLTDTEMNNVYNNRSV